MADSSTPKFFICAAGIFVCYFYYGILQEKITRSTYKDGEKFSYSASLVFVQCLVNVIFAKLMLHTFMKQGQDDTKQSYYAVCALAYLGAMVSSNMALQNVNYPTQVIGKSCKPIPVMILGVLIAKKSYPLAKYAFVLMIVLGVGVFMYKDKPTGQSADSSMIGAGEILLLISLTLDGFTGAIQDKMIQTYHSKSGHMMYFMNFWSTIYLGAGILSIGEIFTFLAFIERNPDVLYNILGFSCMSAIGQMFIFLTVSDFGPLPCSIITTTRKFFTILASVILFGNPMINRQWIGAALVFSGLTLDSIYGKKRAEKTK